MTEVEALLSVDAGQIPPGTVAFFEQDGDPAATRTYITLAVSTAVIAVGCALAGASRYLVAPMLIAAASLGVMAWPTEPDEGETRPIKRQVMVVTPTGLIVRDEFGLRSWQFADLAGVFSRVYNQRPHLVLVERGGTRHAIDLGRFQRRERVREILAERLGQQAGNVAQAG
jgi:hypothetical protein